MINLNNQLLQLSVQKSNDTQDKKMVNHLLNCLCHCRSRKEKNSKEANLVSFSCLFKNDYFYIYFNGLKIEQDNSFSSAVNTKNLNSKGSKLVIALDEEEEMMNLKMRDKDNQVNKETKLSKLNEATNEEIFCKNIQTNKFKNLNT